MYGWIWRHLPGKLAGKLAGCLLLLTAAVAVLFLLVFPWVEPRLPFNDVTVDPGTSDTSGPVPSGTPVSESPSP